MDNNELKLLITIAQMYYEQDLTQNEISKKLSIYRTTISRLLKKAKDQGIVSFKINYEMSSTFLLEKQLKENFNLLHVIVTHDSDRNIAQENLNAMGSSCADYLKKIISDGDILGVSWGSSLAAIAEQLDSSTYKEILCVPMVGGPAGKLESKYHVNTIAYNIASKLHGKSLLMDFPAILEEQLLKDAITKSQHYQQISKYWDLLSIAIFGIGSFGLLDKSIWSGFYGDDDEVKSIHQEKIAGDICSRFYSYNGQSIQTTISDKLINIQLEQLKRVKHRIGIAHSEEKADAIIGAMRGGYLNTLITTTKTAKAILDRVSLASDEFLLIKN